TASPSAAFVAGLLAGGGKPAGADHGSSDRLFYVEQPDVYCAGGAPQPGAPDGVAASIFVCSEPRGCDPDRSCGAVRSYARPARSAGRRRIRIQIKASAQRRRSAAPEGLAGDRGGRSAGKPGVGACDAAAGAAFGSAVDYCEPPRLPRWRGYGTAAESGDPAAGIVCADSRSRAGRAAESGALGAGFGVARSQGACFGDCSGGAGGSSACSSYCVFQRKAASGAVFGALGAGREARDADRRNGIYRQGVAREYADRFARDRETLFADSAAEVERGAEAL